MVGHSKSSLVMPQGLGAEGHAAHEGERPDKIAKAELAMELALLHRPGSCSRRRAISSVAGRSGRAMALRPSSLITVNSGGTAGPIT